uniref:BZIP domain-containing protein n=3 Tax=Gossypium raimondii TaxID=29730 RepID=A0A0D2RF19_GOSRA|nr:hypothetical protein B456_008G139700 [Gossypium raimondii]
MSFAIPMHRIHILHSFSVVFLYWFYMATVQKPASSSDSDPRYANIDEKKRKRMLSNRESARRSRMKKQKLLEDLVNEVSALQKNNTQICEKIKFTTQRFVKMEASNSVLRAQVIELTESLQSLNSMLQMVEDVSGYDVDIPEIPDPLMKPWQLPCATQPICSTFDG